MLMHYDYHLLFFLHLLYILQPLSFLLLVSQNIYSISNPGEDVNGSYEISRKSHNPRASTNFAVGILARYSSTFLTSASSFLVLAYTESK